MGWWKLGRSERSDGRTGKVSKSWLSVKFNNGGKVTDVVVGKAGSSKHDHFVKVHKPNRTRAIKRVKW